MIKRNQYRTIYRALVRARADLQTRVEIDEAHRTIARSWLVADLREAEAALEALEALPLDVPDWKATAPEVAA